MEEPRGGGENVQEIVDTMIAREVIAKGGGEPGPNAVARLRELIRRYVPSSKPPGEEGADNQGQEHVISTGHTLAALACAAVVPRNMWRILAGISRLSKEHVVMMRSGCFYASEYKVDDLHVHMRLHFVRGPG